MKKVLAAALQASILLSICFFLVYQYSAHDSFSEAIKDAKKYLPSTGNVPLQNNPLSLALPPVTSTSAAQEQTTSIENWGGAAPTHAVIAAAASSIGAIPTETPQPSPSPDLPASPPTIKRPQNASSYVQSIMHPDNPLFPRLECPVPTHNRYEYLKGPDLPNSLRPKPKYFFALDLYECAPILPRLLGSVIETMRFLGPENCALSIVEGRSTDGTFEILSALRDAVAEIGAAYFFTTNNINPKAGEGTDRIQALADLRNQALLPLTEFPEHYDPDTTVIFINDVALCMEDLLELIHQRIAQSADMTCAMDWIFGGWSFYDVWISRGMNGDQFFEIPQSGTWDFAENLFWNNLETRGRFNAVRPFQVFACWNGATAFTAKPLLEEKIRFRTNRPGECYLGEPTLFCKDLWYHGYGKIAVIPSVNVGYDDEESRKIKNIHGTVSHWVEKEAEGNVPIQIKWDSKPPALIKCVPTYKTPAWVPWDEGQNITADVRKLTAR